MSIDVMKQALEALEEMKAEFRALDLPYGSQAYAKANNSTHALLAAIEQSEKRWVKSYAGGKPNYTEPEEQPDELMIWKSRAMSAERIIEKFMQPEPKPVFELGFGWLDDATKYPIGTKLYATPPRQWQGLTDEERGQVINANFGTGLWQMAKDLEAKLKEKNT